jgi:hypothetical protein
MGMAGPPGTPGLAASNHLSNSRKDKFLKTAARPVLAAVASADLHLLTKSDLPSTLRLSEAARFALMNP